MLVTERLPIARIHPTALVDPKAKLGDHVEIGPYSIIGPNVSIGHHTKILSHVVIKGHTIIGAHNTFFPFCSIGEKPQDLSYQDEITFVKIGDHNIFREYVSVHRATTKDKQVTLIGNNSLFMAHVHVAHDVEIGNSIILVNSVNLAGHVKINDFARISGGTNISQFVTIGRGSFLGGASGVDRDIPPFSTAYGNRIRLKGVNIIGLKRQDYQKRVISEVVDFYRSMEASVHSPRTYINRPGGGDKESSNEIIREISTFISNSEIGVAQFLN